MSFLKHLNVPEMAKDMADLLVTDEEKTVINLMKNNTYLYKKLSKLISKNLNINTDELITSMYKRAVIDKAQEKTDEYGNKITEYKIADFYTRLTNFAQYEPDAWLQLPKDLREKLDKAYVSLYADGAKSRLKQMQRNERDLIENAFLFTLEETLEVIDSLEKQIYLVPCNCRALADNCEKPKSACLLFEDGINTQWDRGNGELLTKDEAKQIVIEANKNGLMHTSEVGHAICNCCGCCCYPIRASEEIGTTGIWPKRRYDIIWNKEKCINCGKCEKVCNFEAFVMKDKELEFIEDKCIGCTICYSNCPVDAIEIIKLD